MRKTLYLDECGGITSFAALALPVVLGFAALGLEAGQAYSKRAENQRIADMTALAAATALADAPPGTSVKVVEPTAREVAMANGVPADQVRITYIEDYKGVSGQDAVQVTVRASVRTPLANLVTKTANIEMASTSVATLTMPEAPQTPQCFAMPDGQVFCVSGAFTAPSAPKVALTQ